LHLQVTDVNLAALQIRPEKTDQDLVVGTVSSPARPSSGIIDVPTEVRQPSDTDHLERAVWVAAGNPVDAIVTIRVWANLS
jgi:hypothetical protein